MREYRSKREKRSEYRCPKCNVNSPDGRKGSYCIPCRSAVEANYRKDYYIRNKERRRKYGLKWRASNPNYGGKWQEANRDKMRAAYKRFDKKREAEKRALHLARSKKVLDHPGLSQKEWEAIVKKQRGKCNSCGRLSKLTIDHIEPLSSPVGIHAAYNIQGLCSGCNCRKGARLNPGTQLGLALKRQRKSSRVA